MKEVVPEVNVPMEDRAFVVDPLMETDHSNNPPEVGFGGSQLDSLRAAGLITFSKVSTSSVPDPLCVSSLDPLQAPSEEVTGRSLVLSEFPEEDRPEWGFQNYDDVWD